MIASSILFVLLLLNWDQHILQPRRFKNHAAFCKPVAISRKTRATNINTSLGVSPQGKVTEIDVEKETLNETVGVNDATAVAFPSLFLPTNFTNVSGQFENGTVTKDKTGEPTTVTKATNESNHFPSTQTVIHNFLLRNITPDLPFIEAGSSTKPNPLKEYFLFPVPVNRLLCTRPGNMFSDSVIQVTCFCDDVCDVFGDCCSPYSFYCNETKVTGLTLQPNDTECWLQGTRDLLDVYSKYYWVVSTCPSHWPDKTVREKCEYKGSTNDMSLLLPVSSTKANLTFKNVYCAVCHCAESHQAWTPKIACDSSQAEVFQNAKTTTEILNQIQMTTDCMIFFDNPERYPGRPCIGPGGRHIHKTVFDDGKCPPGADAKLTDLCLTGPVSVTYYRNSLGEHYGRNIYCWLCRTRSNFPITFQRCDDKDDKISKSFAPIGFSAIIDFKRESCCQGSWDEKSCQSFQCHGNDLVLGFQPLTELVNLQFYLTIKMIPKQRIEVFFDVTKVCNVIEVLFKEEDIPNMLQRGDWEYVNGGSFHCVLPSAGLEYATVMVPIRLKKSVSRLSDGLRLFEHLEDEVATFLQKHPPPVFIEGIRFGVLVVRNRTSGISRESAIPTLLSPGKDMFEAKTNAAYSSEHMCHIPCVVLMVIAFVCT